MSPFPLFRGAVAAAPDVNREGVAYDATASDYLCTSTTRRFF